MKAGRVAYSYPWEREDISREAKGNLLFLWMCDLEGVKKLRGGVSCAWLLPTPAIRRWRYINDIYYILGASRQGRRYSDG
jgi:hypothetical protein